MVMKESEKIDKKAFGRKLYATRREQQITSERFAELCEVNPTFIRHIESAARLPSLSVFVRMCNQLRVSPNFLLADSLLWDEEDEIAAINVKLRSLSPRQFRTVIGTVSALINELSKPEEPDTE